MVVFRRTIAVIFTLFLLCGLLIWAFSPVAVRMLAKQPLLEQGLILGENSQVRLNPFTSRLTVADLTLQADQKEVLQLQQLTIDYSLWRLLQKQILIHRIELNDLLLLAENSPAGISVAGINVSQQQPVEESAPSQPNQPSEPSHLPFSVIVPAIELNKLNLVWLNKGQRHEFGIDQLAVNNTQIHQSPGANLQLNSHVAIKGVQLSNKNTNAVFASLAGFDSGAVNIELGDQGMQLNSEKIRFEDIVASHNQQHDLPELVAINFVELEKLTTTQSDLSVNQIRIGGGDVGLKIDEAGELLTLLDFNTLIPGENTQQSQPNTTDTAATEEASATPMKITLDKFIVTDPLKISIDDQQKSQAFNKIFEIDKLTLSDIDSSQPDKPVPVAIGIKDADYFTLTTSGSIKPFLPKPAIDLVTQVREFPLNEVAPYLKDSLGFEVLSGQLDSDISTRVSNDELESNVMLFLRGANFAGSNTSEDSNFIGKVAIPLNVALDMLKDDDGNIELKVPVNGDVNDPSFGVHHIIGLVLKKVALSQAKDYLMTTFVPYAKVVSVAIAAGELALKVRLEDLPYQANQIQVQAEQIEFAQQLALLMTDNPNITVNVCGIARADEAIAAAQTENNKAIDAAGISIARGKLFKDYLVTNFKIKSSRLLTCSDRVEDEAEPRIEFNVL